ncbi:MAG: S8 family serine peptidase [Bacillota bacterium]
MCAAAALTAEVAGRLATSGARERIPVVVTLAERTGEVSYVSAPLDGAPAHAPRSRLALDAASAISGLDLATLGAAVGAFELRARWRHALEGFAAFLTPEQVRVLAGHPQVARIECDREVVAFLETATYWTGVRRVWADWGLSGGPGGGRPAAAIAILDTGIDAAHVDLSGGKVVGWHDVLGGRTTPYDDNGHGTHVASIAAGSGAGDPASRGVAYGAPLVGIKVLDQRGTGTVSGVISGLDWMVANAATYGIRAATLCLGAPGRSDGRDALSRAVDRAVARGIVICVAAGNGGPTLGSIGSPAAAALAVSVGALHDPGKRGWVLARFSSRGPTADGRIKPDICAPGVGIRAALAGSGRGYVSHSGTSMSASFIAGVVALMLEAEPSLTPEQVKRILLRPANVKDFGPPGADYEFGQGIAVAYSAIREAGGLEGRWSDDLSSAFRSGYLSRPGSSAWWKFRVSDPTRPIGVTLVSSPGWGRTEMSLELRDPTGRVAAQSSGPGRQQEILHLPSVPGDHWLRVRSVRGAGRYWFSASWR